jgi:intracellular sulfur oxidation DsrE/DsrF family protein
MQHEKLDMQQELLDMQHEKLDMHQERLNMQQERLHFVICSISMALMKFSLQGRVWYVQCISVAANIPFPQLFTVGVK